MKRGRVPEDPGGCGDLASDPCAFITDLTLAGDAEVIAIGRPEDQDGRET